MNRQLYNIPVEQEEDDCQRRYDEVFALFNKMFKSQLNKWSGASYGGPVVTDYIKEIVHEGKVPRRLKNLTMMCVWRTQNWNDGDYQLPVKFFKKHNIKMLYHRYIPADNINYYLIYSKDVNFAKLAMTEEEREDMDPIFLDLKPFYEKLYYYTKLTVFW